MSLRCQYVSVKNKRHPVVVSYRLLTGPDEDIMLFSAGFSVCHDSDKFDRKLGRVISDGRHNKAPTYGGFVGQDVSQPYGKRIVGTIIRYVRDNYDSIIKNL